MANRIDRLFQDKLARHEVSPTPEAWKQVVVKLDNGKKPTYWLSIAASVAVLAVSAFLLLRSNVEAPIESVDFIANDQTSQPSPLADLQWDLPEIKEAVVIKREPKRRTAKIEVASKDVIDNTALVNNSMEIVEDSELIEVMPIIDTSSFTEAEVVVDEATIFIEEQEEKLPQLRVQITYMASETAPVVEEEKTKIGKLLAKARQIKPGSMLASIRDTKNDFFSGKRN